MSTIAEELRSLTKAVETGGGGKPANWYKYFTLDKLSNLHTHYDDFINHSFGVMYIDIESMGLESAPVSFAIFKSDNDYVHIFSGTDNGVMGASSCFLITSESTTLVSGQIGSYKEDEPGVVSYVADTVSLKSFDSLVSNIRIFITTNPISLD